MSVRPPLAYRLPSVVQPVCSVGYRHSGFSRGSAGSQRTGSQDRINVDPPVESMFSSRTSQDGIGIDSPIKSVLTFRSSLHWPSLRPRSVAIVKRVRTRPHDKGATAVKSMPDACYGIIRRGSTYVLAEIFLAGGAPQVTNYPVRYPILFCTISSMHTLA